MKKSRVALIGARGHIGYVLAALPECRETVEIAGLAAAGGDDLGPLRGNLRALGIEAPEFADYRAMLDEAAPEIAVVCGPFEQHAAMSVAALERNIHVLVEKPAALTLPELAALEAALRRSRASLVSMVGLRYDNAIAGAKELVDRGAVGKVKLINARKSYKLGRRPDYYRSRATYGGTIPWVGSHALDWIRYFSGSEAETVSAIQTRTDNRDHGDLEIAAQCQLQMRNGVLASASIDYLRPAAAATHGDDRLRVAGTDGIVEVAGGKVTVLDGDGERVFTPPPCPRQLFSDFLAAIRDGRPAWTDSADTIELTRLCLLARQAADTGEVVRLPH